MKSISLDSPDADSGSGGLRHRNMSVPKGVDGNTVGGENNNFGTIGIGNRRYGGWANIVRSRMASQQQAIGANILPRRMVPPPNSMEFGMTTSAPPSYNQCNFPGVTALNT